METERTAMEELALADFAAEAGIAIGTETTSTAPAPGPVEEKTM